MSVVRVSAKRDAGDIDEIRMKTVPATQVCVSRGFSALILGRPPDVLAWRAKWNFERSDAPIGRFRPSALAPGRSGGRSGRSRTMSRWRRCTGRSIAGSTSSTPPTSTATGAASGCWRGCARSARSRSTSRPRRGGGCPSRRSRATTRRTSTAFVDRSLKNLATDTIDLLQIHCPPTDAFYHPEVFELFDDLVKAGKIRFYGVSVERVEEGLKALDYPGRAVGADRLQHLPPAAARPVPGRGAPAQGRRAGAAAAVVGDAGGQDDAREQVRRRRPPQLQPRGRAVGQGRDLLGRPVRGRAGGGRGAAQAGARRRPRWRRSRCAGS